MAILHPDVNGAASRYRYDDDTTAAAAEHAHAADRLDQGDFGIWKQRKGFPDLSNSYIPAGVRTLTPFLHAHDAARQIGFLKQAFAAAEERREEAEGVVRYTRLRIGDAAFELGEAQGQAGAMPSAFYLYVGDADVVYERALAAGAKSLWPPSDQPYGDRTGGVEDAMGNQWFIARPA